MSETRRTEGFTTIKSRQLILQNLDGSYPEQGSIITIADRGKLVPSQDITVRNVTVTGTPTIVNPPEYQDISARNIVADNITTRTLTITDTNPLSVYDLCANRVKTTDLTTTEILASGTSSLDHIYSLDIRAQDISATHIISQDIITTHIVTGTASAAVIHTDTIRATGASHLDHIYSLDISAQDIQATHITSQDISATNATVSTSAYIQNITVPDTADISDLKAYDILATNVTIRTSAYIETATIPTIFANNVDLTGDITITETVTAFKGVFEVLHIGTFQVDSYYFPVLEADTLIGKNVNITESLTVTGSTTAQDIGAQDITATSLTVTSGPTHVQDIQATNITATSLAVTGGHTSVQDMSATSLTVNGPTRVEDLDATSLTVRGGSTTVKDLSATSLYVAGATNADTLHTTTITTAEQTVSNYLTINGPSLTEGVLTYNISRGGLLVNGIPVSISEFLLPVAFKRLEDQGDFTSNLNTLFTSYTKYLGLLDSKYLIIRLSPDIIFASTCSIQFIVNGIPKAPVVFEKDEILPLDDILPYDSILKRLNDVGGTSIRFRADTTRWRVTLDISGTGNQIADVSGMPTGSLQVLRYLGFGPLDTSSNPFETYALNGRQYVPTFKDLSDGYRLVGTPLPELIEYPNGLQEPAVDISSNVDPYTLPVRFTNRPTGNNKYMAIQCNGSYKLYPTTFPDVSLNGLTPNTSYPIIFNYLDLSNNTTVPETGTTAKIPFPTDLSVTSITYKSFRAFWTQPYPGKTYTFLLDLSGRDTVTSYAVSDISNTFTGIYNNTDYDVRIRSFDLAFVDCSSNYSPYVRVHTDPLNAPTDLSANDITTLSFNVTWKYPYSYYSDIRFSINIKGGGIDDTSTTNDLSKPFYELNKDTQYDITIKAYDPTFPDNSSVESTLSVRTASVDTPFNLSLTAKSYKSISVGWDIMGSDGWDSSILYVLDISGRGALNLLYMTGRGEWDDTSFTFINRYDDTDYDIRVCVVQIDVWDFFGNIIHYLTEFSPPLRVRTDSFKEPIIISANTITTNSFNVAWTFPYSYDPAVRYLLNISEGGTFDTNALTYVIAGLNKNTQYYITIEASDSSMPGYQYNSGPSTFSVRTYLYDPPTNVSSNTITYKSFNVSWTHPSDDPAIRYSLDISANGTVINTYNAINTLSYAFTGVSNNTDYDIRVQAYDPDIPNSLSTYSPYLRVRTAVFNAPTGLSSNTITYKSFNVTWDNPYPGNTNISYILTIAGGGENTTYNNINATTYAFTGLNSNTSYNITVATYDSVYTSASSTALSISTAVFNAPTGLSSNTITTTSFSVTWNNPYPGDTNISYILNITGGGINVTYNTTATTYAFTGLNNNTSYNITVATYDSVYTSAVSTPLSVSTTVFNAPTGLSSNTITYKSFNVTWDNPYPGNTNISYILNITGGGENTTYNTTALTYAFTGLKNNTSYNITVATYDSTSPTYTSASSTALSVSTTVFNAPTGLSSSSITYQSFNASWNNPYSGDSNIRFILNITGGGINDTYNNINATPYTFSGLKNNTVYNITVATYDLTSPTHTSAVSTLSNISTSTPFGITSAAAEPKVYTYLSSGELGYLIPPSSPWIGCTFNTIKILGAYGDLDGTYSALTLNAYIYDGPTKVPSALVSSFNSSPFYTPYTGSDTLNLLNYSHLATTAVYGIGLGPFDITLKFGSTFTITNNTIIFVQGLGSSFVSFPTTDLNTYPNTEVKSAAYGPALFNSVNYGYPFFLYNWSATDPKRMLICTLDTT